MQSTSFWGSRVLQISSWSALRCFGRGRNISTPWMESSALICLIWSINCKTANASTLTTCSADSIIVIEPIPTQYPDTNVPRSPALVPISASYEAMLSTLFLTFTSNLGEIEVEVLNTTSGGYDSGTVDTQFLYATVPITMGPGHYLILFTLPSGQRYKGELDN